MYLFFQEVTIILKSVCIICPIYMYVPLHIYGVNNL